jgi:putative transcriptional regulator
MNKKRRTTKTRNTGSRIIAGLTDLRDTLRSGQLLEKRFNVRSVEIPKPQEFTPTRIRELRDKLQLSQGVFAKLLGISRILAQSWEQGIRTPSPMACRLLTDIERDPARWRKLISVAPVDVPRRRKSA